MQRQPVRDGCREEPKAYPASVLPTSHIRLEAGLPISEDFIGVLPRMADKAQIIVPQAYLNDAPASLPRVILIADASAVRPDRAIDRTMVHAGRATDTPQHFLKVGTHHRRPPIVDQHHVVLLRSIQITRPATGSFSSSPIRFSSMNTSSPKR